MRHLNFHLPTIVAQAIAIGSAARYPTAPVDAPPRTYSLEASRARNGRYFSVHCAEATAPLIIADIEHARDKSEVAAFRAECDTAIAAIRAELEAPAIRSNEMQPTWDLSLIGSRIAPPKSPDQSKQP